MKYQLLKRKSLLLGIFTLACAQHVRSQDNAVLVSAFFGLDNAMPFQANFLCPGAAGMDGMPVNFLYPIDASTLSASDFEVIDNLGNVHVPICAVLTPANENGENRTVLLIGELGNASTNPPAEVRVVDDLFTTQIFEGEYACSEIVNLNGISSTNVVSLDEGPSIFFAQKIDGNLDECNEGVQTIQVAWNGGITPYSDGDTEADLFQYYTGYSESAGVLIPHTPISIADINDNDNFHQLCFSTADEIVKISMIANSVEDPNQDPNLYSEIEVLNCTSVNVKEHLVVEQYKIYPNPASNAVRIQTSFPTPFQVTVMNAFGQVVMNDWMTKEATLDIHELASGQYILKVEQGSSADYLRLMVVK